MPPKRTVVSPQSAPSSRRKGDVKILHRTPKLPKSHKKETNPTTPTSPTVALQQMQFKTRLTMEMIPSPPPAPMKGKRTAGRKKEAHFKTPTTPNVPLQQMQFKTRLTMEMIPTPPAAPKQRKRNAGRKTQPRTKPVPKRKKQGPIKPLPPRPDEEEYGDRVSRKKAKNVTRVCLQNINRLPLEARPNTETALGVPFNKNHQFCQAVKDKSADIFLFSEHGLNFHKLPAEDQWNERALHQLPPGHVALLEANTSEEPAAQGKQPWGGTGLIAMPEMKPRSAAPEHPGPNDPGWLRRGGRGP